MRIFVSGGCKNGKSYYAQQLSKNQQNYKQLYYIATMKPSDNEDDERIIRHRQEREGWGFITIEQQFNIENILDKCDCNGSFLLDSLTALLANEMFFGANFNNQNVMSGLLKIVNQIQNIVIVSDYIYGDGHIYDPIIEEYRSYLAILDRMMAEHCDVVLEVAYTKTLIHKGEQLFEKIR